MYSDADALIPTLDGPDLNPVQAHPDRLGVLQFRAFLPHYREDGTEHGGEGLWCDYDAATGLVRLASDGAPAGASYGTVVALRKGRPGKIPVVVLVRPS